MSNRTIEAVLRLSSKLGNMRAFGKLANHMDRVDRKAKAFNRTQSAIAASTRGIAVATARFLAPAAVAYGTQRAVVEYARLERQLTRTGLKIGASRRDMVDLNASAIGVAQRYAVANDAVIDTIDAYAETGAELKDIRADMDGLVKAQQGMGASGQDVVSTWDAARKSFGMLSKDAESFFDMVAAGGNSGKFEGSDLARYLPSILPTAAVHGMSGLTGTAEVIGALEAMRDRTGESSTAATSLQDFLDKLNSPNVQGNFKKLNIDLPKALSQARRDGVPLFEAMSKLLQKATGGNAGKLGALFTERDSRNFALMLMQDIDGLLARIRKLKEESKGTIQINVDAVMKDSQAAIDRLSNSYDRMTKSFGASVSSPLGSVMDKISDYLDYSNAVKRGLESEGKSAWDDYGLSDEDRAKYAAKGHYKSAEDRQVEANQQRLDDANRAYRDTGRHRSLSFSFGVDANGTPYPRSYDPVEYSDFGKVGGTDLETVPSDLLTRRDRGRAISALMDVGADENYQDFISAAQAPRSQPGGAMVRTSRAYAAAKSEHVGEGRSTSEAAEVINRVSEQGGSTFARMLEGVGEKFGQEAAQSGGAMVRAARAYAAAKSEHVGDGRSTSEAAEVINRVSEQGGSTFARMLEGVGEKFGQEAAQSISQAGRDVGEAGGQAGSAIQTAAQAIVTAGNQAAAAIRAAGADLLRPIGVLGLGHNRPPVVSGDFGRSMPNAGIPEGQLASGDMGRSMPYAGRPR